MITLTFFGAPDLGSFHHVKHLPSLVLRVFFVVVFLSRRRSFLTSFFNMCLFVVVFFSPLRSLFDNQTHIRNFIRLVNELRTCSVSYVKKFTVLGFLAAEFQLLPCVEILASSVLRVAWCDTS